MAKVWQGVLQPSDKYTSFNYFKLKNELLFKDLKTLFEFFFIFVFEKTLSQWANWTNANATQDKKNFDETQTQEEKKFCLHRL